MYVYNVQDGEDANSERNGSSKSDDNDAEHNAESESVADTEPESGGESRTESEPERKSEAGTESHGASTEPDSHSKSQPPRIIISHEKAQKSQNG